MDISRYYFNDYIEDEVLGIVAVQAAELLKNNDDVVKIFKRNYEGLYGLSPRQTLFLMKQNNKSIFSSSPSYENNPGLAKLTQGLFKQPIRNRNARNIPRRQLSFDDEEKVSDSRISEPITPIKHQKVISPREKFQITFSPTAESDKQLESPSGSTCSPKRSNQESPRSAELAKMTSNLTMAEIELESAAKLSDNNEPSNKYSPGSTALNKVTSNRISNTNSTILQEYVTTGLFFHRACPRTSEKLEDSYDFDSTNKYSTSQAVVIKASPPVLVKSETPSPMKKLQIWRPFTVGDDEIVSPTKKFAMANSSPEDTSPIQIDKIDCSPNFASNGIGSDARKRKSLSPQQKSMQLFRSLPRVIKSVEEAEIDVEVPLSLEENSSPTTSFKVKSPLAGEPTNQLTRKIFLKRHLSPSEQVISATSSQNISKETSPVSVETKTDSSQILQRYSSPSERAITFSDLSEEKTVNMEDIFVGKQISDVPSVAETAIEDRACKFENGSSGIETNSFILTNYVLKLNTLLVLREQIVRKRFTSLLSFMSGVEFLLWYVNTTQYIVTTIGFIIHEDSIKELKDRVDSATATVTKLEKKLMQWKSDIVSEVATWQKSVDLIQQEKAKYEPLLSKEGKPNLSAEDLQMYECKMKNIWRTLDDMILISDSRRVLFSHISHDIVRLMQNLVNCLILVGILLPR